MRAIRARYNPYVQARGRVDQLRKLGHSVDKVPEMQRFCRLALDDCRSTQTLRFLSRADLLLHPTCDKVAPGWTEVGSLLLLQARG